MRVNAKTRFLRVHLMISTRVRELALASLCTPLSVAPAGVAAGVQNPEPARQPLTLEEVLERPETLSPQLPTVQWLPGGTTYSIISERASDDGPVQVAFRRAVVGQLVEEVFDAKLLHEILTRAGAEGVDPKRLPPFTWIGEDTVRVVAEDAVYHWDRGKTDAVKRVALAPGATLSAIASSDEQGAFIVDYDLVVRKADGSLRRVTWDGSADIAYGGAAHRAEFGITDGLWWGPAGRYLAFSREDLRPIRVYPYADYTDLPARPVHGRYPMAGREHSKVQIGVYDSATDGLCYLERDPAADLYWTNVTFHPDGDRLYVALVERGQTRMELVEFDARTGERGATLIRESDPEWIEPEHGPLFIDGQRFLWFSPRDGFHHLYQYGVDGKLHRQVTSGSFDVAELVGFSADRSRCWVTASGANPLEMHLWAVELSADHEGPAFRKVTSAQGWHAAQVAPETGHVLDAHSNLTSPGTLELLPAEGDPTVVFRAKNPYVGRAIGPQQFFDVRAEDGSVLHGHLVLPPDFDRTRRYPVLHYVYGGPHSQLVRDAWNGGASLWLHFMASNGFVVSRLDNRGTANRGIKFAQTVYRQLGTLEVHDQLRAIDWLKNQSFVDTTRIGVHGWSYGGYMTLRLMLLAPDTFRCGISGAPVTDWARYETGYTERYMDTPAENPDGYLRASCLPLARHLRGRLLLVHGTDDKTVMFSHAMAFLRACIDEGVLLDFMTYPMQQHGMVGGDRKHLYRMMTRFFEERLR